MRGAPVTWCEGARRVNLHAGAPPVLDLIHLGLGTDGYTASLVPGDAALSAARADVALTGFYKGTRRMTMTLETINRARCILWVVVGRDKGRRWLGWWRAIRPSRQAAYARIARFCWRTERPHRHHRQLLL